MGELVWEKYNEYNVNKRNIRIDKLMVKIPVEQLNGHRHSGGVELGQYYEDKAAW